MKSDLKTRHGGRILADALAGHGVRAAFHAARKSGMAVQKDGLKVKQNGHWRDVSVEVVPLSTAPRNYSLVLFHAAPLPQARVSESAKP